MPGLAKTDAQGDACTAVEYDSDIESSEVKQYETARKFFTPRTFGEGSLQTLCFEKSLEKLTSIGTDQQTFTRQLYFRDAEELRANINGNVTDVKGKECFWHLVDSVDIKCPFSILRHHLEFIGSPGLGELNQTRMASTNRAKHSADLLCIIGDTGRIKANELIMDAIFQAIAHHGPEKIAMIATKTDMIVDQDIKVKKTMATTQKFDKKILRQLSRYEGYVLRQMKESARNTVAISVYEKPISVFARELLLKLLKEGASPNEECSDVETEEDDDGSDTDGVEKIMVALDGMVQNWYKMYANEFADGIRATMQEFLNEIQELTSSEGLISEGSQAAHSRLEERVEELKKDCVDLGELASIRG
ncbi:hypothetical protein EJ02DRAFT_437394 [Clathrospora elynae]|uniref:Uncharacterized protein n=1 Tax=Clathrospora elynae TaxID=706981 RepID=A0A6A5SBV6_9PLEO|nr:hypothetical protein EJ02DRAFT_437394 [Clathrospora elynae]